MTILDIVYWIGNGLFNFQTLIALLPTAVWYFYKEKRDKKLKIKALASAILAELESVEARYKYVTNGGFKPDILKADQNGNYYLSKMPIAQDYFTVFTANASKIDAFNVEEARIIVTFYTTAKGFIDTINAWNQDIEKYDTKILESLMNATYSNPDVAKRIDGILGDIPYRLGIVLQHQELVLSQLERAKDVLKKYVS